MSQKFGRWDLPAIQSNINQSYFCLEIWDNIIKGLNPKEYCNLFPVCRAIYLLFRDHNIPLLLKQINTDYQSLLIMRNPLSSFKLLSNVLSSFEILDFYQQKESFKYKEGFPIEREKIFNFMHLFRYSLFFNISHQGSHRLQRLTDRHHVPLEMQFTGTLKYSIMREPIVTLLKTAIGAAGIGAFLWVSIYYLPGVVSGFANSQAFADALTCLNWACYESYRAVEGCFTTGGYLGQSVKIPPSSLNDFHNFSDVFSPITNFIQEKFNMTDPQGLHDFIEASRTLFLGCNKPDANHRFQINNVKVTNNRLHLFADFVDSYVHHTYINLNNGDGPKLYQYTPECIARELSSDFYSPFVWYQVGNGFGLIAWCACFVYLNYLIWW